MDAFIDLEIVEEMTTIDMSTILPIIRVLNIEIPTLTSIINNND